MKMIDSKTVENTVLSSAPFMVFVSRRDNLSYHAFDFVSMERYTARSMQSENGTLPSLAL